MYATHSIMESNHYIARSGAKRSRPDASPLECRGDFVHGLLEFNVPGRYVEAFEFPVVLRNRQ